MLFGEEILTVRTAPIIDDGRGGKIRDWANATETIIVGAVVHPIKLSDGSSAEINGDRSYARTSMKVYAPGGTVVNYYDRVVHRGIEYDVSSHSRPWTDFEGMEDHVAFIMQRREG